MSDAKKIRQQKKVRSTKVSPEKALKDLDKLKEETSKGVTGGWADLWTPTPAFRPKF